MDDLDVVASGHDSIVDPEVEASSFHHNLELVILRLYPLEEVTDVADIGPYAVVTYELSVRIQNAEPSVLFMYVQSHIVHGSFRPRLLTKYRIGEEPVFSMPLPKPTFPNRLIILY
ncbi:MAG: hypothetical protein AMQ22_02145 [Candidatus Methanofastidiosum methylothiophilum]|uniref:Uncharacterized protein n=1 Tax=Candidatus Methanofastidiosum methylothiophilum TaxID=1705564 RepID=A0A150IN13_9EURY|nr:MAG: hypothetical protein AMQ22_02145 [Candidatus Methanofastidiosum methylthiophilus]